MKTVVITEALAGVGAATARRFVKERFRLVLLARRKDKLEDLQNDLHKTEVHILMSVYQSFAPLAVHRT